MWCSRSSSFLVLAVCLVVSSAARGQVAIPLLEANVLTSYEDPVTDTLFVGTSKGLYYTQDGIKLHKRRLTGGKGAHSIHCIGSVSSGDVLLGSDDGLFRVSSAGYERVDLPLINERRVFYFVEDPDTKALYLGTEQGLFVRNSSKDQGQPVRQLPVKGRITFLGYVENRLFVATAAAFYEVNTATNAVPKVGESPGPVTDVVGMGNRLYLELQLGGYLEVYEYNLARAVIEGQVEKSVLDIAVVGKVLWISVEGNLESYASGRYEPVAVLAADVAGVSPVEIGRIKVIKETPNWLWLVSSSGVFRRARNAPPNGYFARVLHSSGPLEIERIVETATGIWLLGQAGAYLIHEDVEIRVQLNFLTLGSWNVPTFREIRVSDVGYYFNTGRRFFHGENSEFELNLTRRMFGEVDRLQDSSGFQNTKSFKYRPGSTVTTLRGEVRDSHGNASLIGPFTKVVFLPSFGGRFSFAIVSFLAFYLGVILLMLTLAILPIWASLRMKLFLWAIGLWRHYPLLKTFATPAMTWVRWLFHPIYRARIRSVVGSSHTKVEQGTRLLETLSAAEQNEAAGQEGGAKLVAAAIASGKDGSFGHSLPLTLKAEDLKQDFDAGYVETMVRNQLKAAMRTDDGLFIGQLLVHEIFTFVVEASMAPETFRAGFTGFNGQYTNRHHFLVIRLPG